MVAEQVEGIEGALAGHQARWQNSPTSAVKDRRDLLGMPNFLRILRNFQHYEIEVGLVSANLLANMTM